MRAVLAVFVGGFLGTALRFILSTSVPHSAELATFIINIVGSFVLGLLISTVWVRPSTPTWLKAGLGTGLLGGFTTFSAIAIDAAETLPYIGTEATGSAWGTIVFLVIEILVGIAAAWAGLALGGRRSSKIRIARSSTSAQAVITDDGGDI